MNKYWFKPKTYGYGYVPISVEGWIATVLIIIAGVGLAYINNIFTPMNLTWMNGLLFVLEVLILGFIFVKVFEKRCNGKLKWNWGKKRR